MANDDEELELLFDPDPFIASVEKMKASFDKFADALLKKDDFTQKKMITSSNNTSGEIFKAFKKLAVIGSIFVGIFGMLKKAWNNIPELGMAFKIAGEIFMRNFLWPLRRQLIPLLNNFLKWVRDNRVAFVQWGNVLVNIFSVIKTLISTSIKLIRSLISGFLDDTNKGVSNLLKKITDAINLTLFKITMILAFIGVKLEPIMESLGGIFKELIGILKNFAKGFIDTFLEIADSMGILEDLKKIMDGIKEVLEFISPAFEVLGNILGTKLAASIKLLILPLKILLKFLGGLKDLVDKKIDFDEFLSGLKDETFESLKDVGKGIFESVGKTIETGKKAYKNMTGGEDEDNNPEKKPKKPKPGPNNPGTGNNNINVDDAIIKPNGQVIKTNPLDTIFAMKNPGGNKLSGDIYLNFENYNNITVTEGNAKKAGENFGEGMMDIITRTLKNQYVLAGNK